MYLAPASTESEEKSYLSMIKSEDCRGKDKAWARNKLVLGVSRLVYSLAQKYRPQTMTVEDLYQEGMVEVMNSVDKFDASFGYRFCSFAGKNADLRMRSAIGDQDPMVRNKKVRRSGTGKHPDVSPSETFSSAHPDNDPEEAAIAAETRDVVRAALADLPERERDSVLAIVLHGESLTSYGESLGIHADTVRALVDRGLHMMLTGKLGEQLRDLA